MSSHSQQTNLYAKREQILRTAARHGASRVRIFGSVALGTPDQHSDIDFLVDLAPDRSLLDLGGLLYDLRQLLGTDVDVVTENGLRPRIRARVLAEAIDLCEVIANVYGICLKRYIKSNNTSTMKVAPGIGKTGRFLYST